MKVSFSLFPFGKGFNLHDKRLSEALEFLAGLGYNGVDAEVDWKKHKIKSLWENIRQLLETYNLKLVCILGPINLALNSPSASTRKASVEVAKALINIANQLDCENLLIGGAKLPLKVSTEKALSWTAKAMREVADYAAEHDAYLLFEYWNRFETNFINNTDGVMKLLETVNSDRLYAVLDTFHMNIEEKSFDESIRKLGKKLRHVHLSESNRLSLGRGHINFRNVLKTLREIGYDEYCCVEIFYYRAQDWPKKPFLTAKEYARESIDFLKRLEV